MKGSDSTTLEMCVIWSCSLISAVVSFAGEGVSAGSFLVFRFRDYMPAVAGYGKRREANVGVVSRK